MVSWIWLGKPQRNLKTFVLFLFMTLLILIACWIPELKGDIDSRYFEEIEDTTSDYFFGLVFLFVCLFLFISAGIRIVPMRLIILKLNTYLLLDGRIEDLKQRRLEVLKVSFKTSLSQLVVAKIGLTL